MVIRNIRPGNVACPKIKMKLEKTSRKQTNKNCRKFFRLSWLARGLQIASFDRNFDYAFIQRTVFTTYCVESV